MIRKISLAVGLMGALSLLTSNHVSAAAPSLKWSRDLPGAVIRESSPMPINFDGGSKDIIFGAHNGQVYILNGDTGNYTSNWPQPTVRPINSSASSADVDGDGKLDIFIGSGTSDTDHCSGGGMYRFAINGSIKRYTPTFDGSINCISGVQSSPVIGDTNNNNQPDIAFGTLGLRSWSINPDGNQNVGWPMYWDDTQFATPALADANGDGVTDIIMGGDSTPGGVVDHRGGMVRAVTGEGSVIWEYRVDEMVRSSPVVGDIDGDGVSEVIFGTGNYWASQPGGARDSTKIFVLNLRTGQLKWSKDLGAQTLASPALGDVDGDGVRDIVIGTWQGPQAGKIWAIKGNGAMVAGFPRSSAGGIVLGQVSLADLNNDGRQDILVPTGGGVFAYSGNGGGLLWGIRQGVASYQNSPYIGDIDGNGKLDIVIAGTRPNGTGIVDRYEFSTAVEARLGNSSWPMFHGDDRLTGNVTPPPLRQNIHIPPGAKGRGYMMASNTGQVYCFGSAVCKGSVTSSLTRPIVDIASVPNKNGYWMVASDGGIFSFGDAGFHGSTGNITLNKPIVGMAATPSGNGYWMVASDGGIFSFGDAGFHGSTGNIKLNKPIVSIIKTTSGNGYWMVASDGGIFSFGDAGFHGSVNVGGGVVSGAGQAGD